jgi:hypothetical protein
MTIVYRSVKGVDLVPSEVDGNFADLDTRTAAGWRDMVCGLETRSGPTQPVLQNFRNGIYLFAFSPDNLQEAFATAHIDHDYKPGSDFHIHAHWSCAAGATGNVKWYFEIMYAKGHNQAAFPAAVTSSVVQAASATAYRHMVAEVQMSAASPSAAQVDSDLLEVDGILLVRAYRNRDDVADTCNQSVFLHTVDIHYQTDRTATINKAPNFYGV